MPCICLAPEPDSWGSPEGGEHRDTLVAESQKGVRSGLIACTGTKGDTTYLQNTLPGSPLLPLTGEQWHCSPVHLMYAGAFAEGRRHFLRMIWQDKAVPLPIPPICLQPRVCVGEQHSTRNKCPGAGGTLSVLGAVRNQAPRRGK